MQTEAVIQSNTENVPVQQQSEQQSQKQETRRAMFQNVSSSDFLNFSFNDQKYADQLHMAQVKKHKLSALDVFEVTFQHGEFEYKYVECSLDFSFMGGTLGCAEGQKYVLASDYCIQHKIPLILKAQSGGVRVQEGCVALMQMAVANGVTEKLRNNRILTVSVATDPCFGGTSASVLYATDIQLAEQGSRHGFAGPAVIANAIYSGNLNELDRTAPRGFQQAEYFAQKGYVHKVIPKDGLESYLQQLVAFFSDGKLFDEENDEQQSQKNNWRSKFLQLPESDTSDPPINSEPFSYLRCRENPRPLQLAALVFDELIELGSDESVGTFMGRLVGIPVLFLCTKYAKDDDLAGLGTPVGYRTVAKYVDLASRFDIPVISFVDTAGALPTAEAEEQCQAQAVSQAISALIGCKAPVLSVITGEGGSGGALALAAANNVAALERTFYNVISPEGGASILLNGRKPTQHDCDTLAEAQQCFSHQLHALGVVDRVISHGNNVSELADNVRRHLINQLHSFCTVESDEVQQARLRRFLGIGRCTQFKSLEDGLESAENALSDDQKTQIQQGKGGRSQKQSKTPSDVKKLLQLISEKTVNGILAGQSAWKVADPLDLVESLNDKMKPVDHVLSMKKLLDQDGPEAVKNALLQAKQPLITDTTARDAHQSLFSTRFRTREIKAGLELLEKSQLPISGLLFSSECWGGATFDTMLRFLRENPWERLAEIRSILPNTLTQLLVRGDNLLGYNAYGLETARNFVDAAQNVGMDVFRVFDAFNDLNGVKNVAQAVLDNGKAILQLCICYTGGIDDPDEQIYTLDYYRAKAEEIYQKWPGCHMIVVKDMSGLLTPIAATKLVTAIREATNNEIPIGVHTHDVSGGQIATVLAAAEAGAAVIDLATASMAARGSQAPIQAFLASRGIYGNVMDNLTIYDQFWHCLADIYASAGGSASASPEVSKTQSESSQNPPVANVAFAQIPGGQRSNLLAQCRAAGQESSFETLVDLYAQVDKMLGHIIKVTPSSKVVGDLALYMLQNGLKVSDVLDKEKSSNYSFPQSVKDFAKGSLGIPHIGMNKQFVSSVLQIDDDEVDRIIENVITNGKPIKHVDYDQITQEVKQLDPNGNIDLDVISYVLFTDVFKSYIEFTNKYSRLITQLPAVVFLHGMQCGQKIQLSHNGITYDVELNRIKYPDQNGSRDVFFRVNGENVKIKVIPQLQEKTLKQQINPKDHRQLGSDLTGTIGEILVKQNDIVKKGQIIMKICGAKLEVSVCAKNDGRVQLRARKGDKVTPNTLVALVE